MQKMNVANWHYSLFSIAEEALRDSMYRTDSSVPDLMPPANPKSATLQL